MTSPKQLEGGERDLGLDAGARGMRGADDGLNHTLDQDLDNSRQSADTDATQNAAREDADLLKDFNIDHVLRAGTGVYQVESADTEISGKENGYLSAFASREDQVKHLPYPIRSSPEAKELFDYIRKPCTDVRHLKQRQRLIDIFRNPAYHEKLHEHKHESYAIGYGLSVLESRTEDEYGHKTSVLDAYRSSGGDVTGQGQEAVEAIMHGKSELSNMITLLCGIQHPFMDHVVRKLEILQKILEPVTPDFIRTGKLKDVKSTLDASSSASRKHLEPVGLFIEFAHISVRDGFSRASYDGSKPLEYKAGWNFARSRKPVQKRYGGTDGDLQITNDSPREHPLIVYTGSNMSGKSFELKKVFYMQLLAQSFGYTPCEEGNFAVYDSFHYLDRAATDTARDLSAFGKEVMDWKNAISSFGDRPFICCDEGFSTTSPEDQYRLLAAADLFLRGKGARVFLATHNEAFILRNVADQNIGLYHLKTEVDDAGKVKYHHALQQGPSDSMALNIAKSIGLPDEVLDMAKAYLAGEFPSAKLNRAPKYRPLKEYDSEAREKLKLLTNRFNLFPGGRDSKGALLHLFSEDSDFQGTWNSSVDTNVPRLKYETLRPFGGIEHERVLRIHDFLFNFSTPSSEEVRERQHLFGILSPQADFEDANRREMDFRDTIYFMKALLADVAKYAEFNLHINPVKSGHSYERSNEFMAYLELHKILLGEAFPLGAELTRLREMIAMRDIVDRASDDRKIDSRDIHGKISEYIQTIHSQCSLLPPVSLFDDGVDLDLIRPLVMKIITPRINELRANIHAETFDDKENFAMGLRILFHERDAVGSYLEWMRGFDSIHIQQMANSMEGQLRKIIEIDSGRSASGDPGLSMMPRSGKALHDLIKLHHKEGLQEQDKELKSMERESSWILAALGHGCYEQNHFDAIREYGSNNYSRAEMCLRGEKKWRESGDHTAKPFIQWAMAEKYGGSGKVQMDAFLKGPHGRAGTWDMIMDRFFREEFVDSRAFLLERFAAMRMRFNELGRKAEAYRRVYNIELKDRHGRADRVNQMHQDLLSGNVAPLRDALHGAIRQNVDRRIGKGIYDIRNTYLHYHHETPFEALYRSTSSMTALVIMARMVREQGQVPVKFNTTGEVRMEGAWNLTRAKGNQVVSDLKFGEGERMKLINGANMSGKTFWLKKATFALQWAMATGHAPAQFATMPLMDKVIYLDRVRAKSDNNLSAFGNEITFWKQFLELITREDGAVTVSFLDEIFSTTSPKYQAALGAALLAYTSRHGGLGAVATHHHEMIDRFTGSEPEVAIPYHFSGHTEAASDAEGGGVKLVADYLMKRGHVGSQAIEVARTLGLSEEILKIAEMIK